VKVVLSEHVENLGDRGQVVSVAPGYARNYLLPRRLALEATAANLKAVEQQRKVWAVKEAKEVGEAEALAARLGALELTVTKKAGESGTLYGSVTSSELAELLEARGIVVDRRRIVLDEPIKSVGTYEVPIKLHRQVTGSVRVLVGSQDAQAAE
jgi:large subunit ribosomal protein L9